MTVQVPDVGNWLPYGTDRFFQIGSGLLAVVEAGLAAFPAPTDADPEATRLDGYYRRFIAHGQRIPVEHAQRRQISVTLQKIFQGRPGEQQYQIPKGEPGKAAFQSGNFLVQIASPWVTPEVWAFGPIVARADWLGEMADDFGSDAYIVWSALTALQLGGIERPWQTSSARGEEMVVGELMAGDPSGGQASWTCLVQVMLG